MATLSSRPRPRIDPLEEGQRFIAHTQTLLEDMYADVAQPGTVKLQLEVYDGRIVTSVCYLDHNDDYIIVKRVEEDIEELLDV